MSVVATGADHVAAPPQTNARRSDSDHRATSVSKRDNIGNLIVGVFALTGVILLFSLIFGVFFGGIRILMNRLFPGRVFDRPQDIEIIQLHLRQEGTSDK